MHTSLEQQALGAEAVVEGCKSLAGAERAIRANNDHLRCRPIHLGSEDCERCHVFLCMLANCVEWHTRRRLAPLRFQDDDPAASRARRDTPVVEAARVSERTRQKARTKLPAAGFVPAHLPDAIGRSGRPRAEPGPVQAAIMIAIQSGRLQRRAFDLLGIDLQQNVSTTVTG